MLILFIISFDVICFSADGAILKSEGTLILLNPYYPISKSLDDHVQIKGRVHDIVSGDDIPGSKEVKELEDLNEDRIIRF